MGSRLFEEEELTRREEASQQAVSERIKPAAATAASWIRLIKKEREEENKERSLIGENNHGKMTPPDRGAFLGGKIRDRWEFDINPDKVDHYLTDLSNHAGYSKESWRCQPSNHGSRGQKKSKSIEPDLFAEQKN